MHCLRSPRPGTTTSPTIPAKAGIHRRNGSRPPSGWLRDGDRVIGETSGSEQTPPKAASEQFSAIAHLNGKGASRRRCCGKTDGFTPGPRRSAAYSSFEGKSETLRASTGSVCAAGDPTPDHLDIAILAMDSKFNPDLSIDNYAITSSSCHPIALSDFDGAVVDGGEHAGGIAGHHDVEDSRAAALGQPLAQRGT